MDTVKDAVQLKFENPGDKDSEVVKMLPKEDAVPETKEKIREFDRLFALGGALERTAGMLLYVPLSAVSGKRWGWGNEPGELKEYLEEDINEEPDHPELAAGKIPGRGVYEMDRK